MSKNLNEQIGKSISKFDLETKSIKLLRPIPKNISQKFSTAECSYAKPVISPNKRWLEMDISGVNVVIDLIEKRFYKLAPDINYSYPNASWNKDSSKIILSGNNENFVLVQSVESNSGFYFSSKTQKIVLDGKVSQALFVPGSNDTFLVVVQNNKNPIGTNVIRVTLPKEGKLIIENIITLNVNKKINDMLIFPDGLHIWLVYQKYDIDEIDLQNLIRKKIDWVSSFDDFSKKNLNIYPTKPLSLKGEYAISYDGKEVAFIARDIIKNDNVLCIYSPDGIEKKRISIGYINDVKDRYLLDENINIIPKDYIDYIFLDKLNVNNDRKFKWPLIDAMFSPRYLNTQLSF